ATLATDLRRHLADLPLCAAPNRSLAERWRKWRRRRPLDLPLASLLLASLAAGCLLLGHVNRQTRKAETALVEGQVQLQDHRYSVARETFRHGLALLEDLPGSA